jgi:hypothetical protein
MYRFAVRLADHEAGNPTRTSWRLGHAAETYAVVLAFFTTDADQRPVRAEDGTFEVNAPSVSTLDTLRLMFDHEGMTVVRESAPAALTQEG